MDDIYNLITDFFEEGDNIQLIRNENFYTYIGMSSTKVNNITFPNSIKYQISPNKTKRITSQFIELTYQYFIENNGSYPNRNWYLNHDVLNFEFKSRPCNKSVARGLIMVL